MTKALAVKKSPKKQNLMQKMAQELKLLKAQLNMSGDKLKEIESNQKDSELGKHKYGASKWKKFESGNEKGYSRSIYVNIDAMVQRKPM